MSDHHYDDNVIDLAARRRCRLERSGLGSAAIAAHLLVETGVVPLWDNSDDDFDGGDWAA
ncbi:hypothetical protein [Nocardia arthritidis]|uniref:hypothetical protein n=1 Tax=Nocardia arthritidis TaxID=228602 RepID=UPI0007A4DCC8|nr:hypothetical protein [Nocardia arthritidis]